MPTFGNRNIQYPDLDEFDLLKVYMNWWVDYFKYKGNNINALRSLPNFNNWKKMYFNGGYTKYYIESTRLSVHDVKATRTHLDLKVDYVEVMGIVVWSNEPKKL